ncbi:MAG: hypothetical protein AABZ32_07755 [Bacteroidota bacterium]
MVTVRVRHCEGASPEAIPQRIFWEIASPQSGLAMTMPYGNPNSNLK